MNSWNWVLPLSRCVPVISAAAGWAMSLVSCLSRSLASSWKGLPISFVVADSLPTFSNNTFEPVLFARGGWYSCLQWHPSSWPTSGPATIHRQRADGSSVTSIVHLMMAYACSCAWSIAIDENWGLDLWTTNLTLFNSAASWGCSFSSLMYQACIFASIKCSQFNFLGSAYIWIRSHSSHCCLQ